MKIITAAAALACSVCAQAADVPSVKVYSNEITVTVNGEKTELTGNRAAIFKWRPVVPLKAFFEAAGADTELDAASKTLTVNAQNGAFAFCADDRTIYKNLENAELSHSLYYGNSDLYMDYADFEKIGYTAVWDADARRIELASKAEQSGGVYMQLDVSADTYVESDYADNSFSSEASVIIKQNEGSQNRKALVEADISAISNPAVQRAQLVYTKKSSEADDEDTTIEVYRTAEYKAAGGVTWNDFPKTGEKLSQNGCTGGKYYLDITDAVKEAIKRNEDTVSVILRGADSEKLRVELYSVESEYKPYILVTYKEDRDIRTQLPVSADFCGGADPWENAERIVDAFNKKENNNLTVAYPEINKSSIQPGAPLEFNIDFSEIGIGASAVYLKLNSRYGGSKPLTLSSGGFSVTEYPSDTGEYIFNITEPARGGNGTFSIAAESRTDIYTSAKKRPAVLVSYSGRHVPWESTAGTNGEYKTTTAAAAAPNGVYTAEKTRTLSDITGFAASDTQTDPYGGDMSASYKATGYFRTEKTADGVWHLITPSGHDYFDTALVETNTDSIGIYKKKFGGKDAWRAEVSARMSELGFGSCGAWSDEGITDKNISVLSYFLGDYAKTKNENTGEQGNSEFKYNNTLSVFDPAFEDFCDKRANELAQKWKDEKRLIGYMSDNELPAGRTLLDDYLTLDKNEPYSVYSYAAARLWFYEKTGGTDISRITDELREEFLEFVYDRYFSVVASAIKKYDTDHLYLGCRFMEQGYRSSGCIKAAGKYCDAVTMNYYNVWTPERELFLNIELLADKPVIVTEFYVKGMDSGMGNTSGAGWCVKTQSDRGDFYQNFALRLLETKNCVGIHWFKYRDNNPEEGGDLSNIDSNKGIVNKDYEEYTDMTFKMGEINKKIYNLRGYLQNR